MKIDDMDGLVEMEQLESLLYEMPVPECMKTFEREGSCKIRLNYQDKARQKAKAVAKRHKRNKNKKTHRKK